MPSRSTPTLCSVSCRGGGLPAASATLLLLSHYLAGLYQGRTEAQGTHLRLQLLLLPADLLLRLLIQLPHIVEMVGVSPAAAGGGHQTAPQDLWNSFPGALLPRLPAAAAVSDPIIVTLGP